MYSLNNISFSDYGIRASLAPGSNVALSGMFDLPERIGETYQTWDDEDGIEPFVEEDEIFFGGRDLVFYGLIVAEKNAAISKINRLKKDIKAFSDLVVFHSDSFGDFNVKIKQLDCEVGTVATTVKLKMREPVCDLSGGALPNQSHSNYTVDRIAFSSFGLTASSVKGRGDQEDVSKEYYTVFDKEGYQLNGRKPTEVKVDGFLKANSLGAFQSNIKALWKILTDPGTRKLRLNDYVTIEGFVTEGFKVANVTKAGNQITATIKLKITEIDEFITVYKHADVNGKILTTADGKILVYG